MNKEQKAISAKRYYAKHKDKVIAYSKGYWNANKDRIKQTHNEWRKNHKKEISDYGKKYREENKVAGAEYRLKNREKILLNGIKNNRRLRYGVSDNWYDERFILQNGLCAICEQPPDKKPLGIDHNHKTGKVRELLCHKCNSAIGLLNEDTIIIQKVLEYLKKHSV
jgi:hypothetical protein